MKTIPEFPNYAITKDGRVWVYSRTDSVGRTSGNRWLKSIIQRNNRCHVTLYHKGAGSPKLVHRLVLETFVGPCPDGMECRHLDGNPANNNLDNLCWGTPKENAKDRELHGKTVRGEKSGVAKLTQKQVVKIILYIKNGILSHSEIATILRTSKATISAIATKRNWGWLWEEGA